MEPVILDSARKRGIADEDIRHAWQNVIHTVELNRGMYGLIGPDREGNLLELGQQAANEIPPVIVHAMPCRDWLLAKARGQRR
ncbi:MAG TPA: hypothetical protein VHV82_08190 [Sporichthyaceae bacterium]|nr:hypothetical protein [Sporichthyaceae bacterium]